MLFIDEIAKVDLNPLIPRPRRPQHQHIQSAGQCTFASGPKGRLLKSVKVRCTVSMKGSAPPRPARIRTPTGIPEHQLLTGSAPGTRIEDSSADERKSPVRTRATIPIELIDLTKVHNLEGHSLLLHPKREKPN